MQEVSFPLPGAWRLWTHQAAWCPQTAGQRMLPHPATEPLIPAHPAPLRGQVRDCPGRPENLSSAGGGEWVQGGYTFPQGRR